MTLRLAPIGTLAQGRLCILLLGLLASACGAKRFTPPAGPGAPFPEYAAASDDATAECRGVKTIEATLSLSGRSGRQRLRGRVDAGFAAPSEVRLEGRAPFGRPVFILVARDDSSATLLLPRDNRVLRDAPPAAIVEALAGVSLTPGELRSIVAGCGLAGAASSGGRGYGDWVAIDAGGVTHYLKRVGGRWRILASARGPLTIEYRDFAAGRPSTIRMRTASPPGTAGAPSDLTLKLSDVNLNVALDPDAFTLDVPAGAEALSLDELRRAGPLGGRD